MNFKRIINGTFMILRMVVRKRIVLILLIVIPAVFLSLVEFTTPERLLPFKLASIDEDVFIQVMEKGISFIFFAVASAGFLVSFLALNLVQKNYKVNRRLVICGYHPNDLLVSYLLSMILIIVIISVYVGILTNGFFSINHLGMFIFGLMLIGLVYGCYALLVGSLIKGELEGILLIVLLVNIDAGWLQNPLFYAGAQNQEIIRFLPAYYPSQTAIISAFTDYSATNASLLSLLYGFGLLFLAMIFFFVQMRIRK